MQARPRFALCVLALTGSLLSPAWSAPAKSPVDFDNVHVTLPDDAPGVPPGEHEDAFSGSCLACHSVEMILNQPKLGRTTWEGIVNKMIHVYKAPVDDADVPKIVDYLTEIQRAR